MAVFEVAAFVLFGWMAGRSIVEGYYTLAIAAIAMWIAAEYLARNTLQRVVDGRALTSSTKDHDRNDLVELIESLLAADVDHAGMIAALVRLLDSPDALVSESAHTTMHFISDRDIFCREPKYEEERKKELLTIVARLKRVE